MDKSSQDFTAYPSLTAVYHTLQILQIISLELKLDYFCLPKQMGLTGFDSKCKDRACMQAGVCTALKDSYEL